MDRRGRSQSPDLGRIHEEHHLSCHPSRATAVKIENDSGEVYGRGPASGVIGPQGRWIRDHSPNHEKRTPGLGQTDRVLLTVSTTHTPATDLGYLLHKHPDRVQEFRQSFGVATVFYPEAGDDRCTAALVLEIDPVRLARSRSRNSPDFTLAQYVNDRAYAASSLLAVALAGVFNTARSGRCTARQELADSAIPLEIAIPVLPCRGGPDIAHRLFEPLGWRVEADPIALDDAFPEWGDSRYIRLHLAGTLRLADALNQLHVLLPVLDEAKHYWQGPDEVDKLLRSGGDWLTDHPDRTLITRRYLAGAAPSPGWPWPDSQSWATRSRRRSSPPRTRRRCSPRRGACRSTSSGTRRFSKRSRGPGPRR